jgi:phage shock protein PspC (stress-responsive transcriptional regulator)
MDKKLYRYPKDGILFGVASGLGKYFNVDPVLVRLVIIVVAILTWFWPVVILYAILFFVIPVDPAHQKVASEQTPKDVTDKERPKDTGPTERTSPEPVERMDSDQNM